MRIAKNNIQIAFFWIVFLFLPCLFHGQNYFLISKAELEKKDVNMSKLDPVNLAADGSYFVAVEGIYDLEKRAQGFTRSLRIIRFPKKVLTTVDTIPLPITHWVNAVVNDTKNEVLVLGNHGTKILKVNLDTSDVQVIWQHTKGKPG